MGGDTITDTIAAGAAGGEFGDAIQASRRKKPGRYSAFRSPTPPGTCSNCATVLSGPVCHSCGQTADTFHRPIWDLLLDILDGLFGLEGRLWRTLPALMFQPGKLTRHYLSGVRARYVTPFRLYLTASLLFFLAFSAVNSGTSMTGSTQIDPNGEAGMEVARESLTDEAIDAQLAAVPGPARDATRVALEGARSSLDRAAEAGPEETPEQREAREQAEREDIKHNIRVALLPELYPGETARIQADEGEDGLDIRLAVNGLPLSMRQRFADGADRVVDTGGEALWTAMKTWAPRLMFALLPIYALLLALTHFYRRGLFFYDHFVVSLHFHAFIFFMFLLVGAVSLAIGPVSAVLLFFLWSNYYLYRLHRSVYEHGRVSSALRTIFLDVIYLTFLSVGFVVLLLVGLLTSV